ncbi:pteridine reductase [uncultured Thiothrix sp.]|uniref:pteridine reductase n=1 Tax=uncultured Thiothrix sp. TaxID=223185 RepID=UPI0026186A97|nr:pteridine reductase [uncultured Thiothrix sp.]HMT92606.1 pteridine reductase [Thiolinea sp.]
MIENSLTGKVVLITGAARRIGAELARCLHAEGATVAIHYRESVVEAEQLQLDLNAKRANSCLLLQADLLKTSDLSALVHSLIEQTQRLDILINNASNFYPTPLASINAQQWDDLMGVNLKAPLFLSQAALPYLQQHHGVIINMTDVHGLRPLAEFSVYCAAKAGLIMLTQVLARELGPQIRVNGIAPGAILWPEQAVSTAQGTEILAKTALERMGRPEDIAKTVLFLVRDAPYITGQVIAVDGGRLLNH